MNNNSNNEDIYPDIYEQNPVFLSVRALQIFPLFDFDADHETLTAIILCNLSGYYFQNLLYRYSPSGDYPEFEEYLTVFASFLKQKKYHRHIINWFNDQVADRELAKEIIADFKNFPGPPEQMHSVLHEIYSFIIKVLYIERQKSTDIFHELYNLAATWMHLQTRSVMQPVSAVNVLKPAEAQIIKGMQKKDNNYYQFYHWGKEYDHYFRELLATGCAEKTAHRNARLKFIQNHPVPADGCDEAFPGLTMKSLKKYQTVYLSRRNYHECL
jgi:hypothetical protein